MDRRRLAGGAHSGCRRHVRSRVPARRRRPPGVSGAPPAGRTTSLSRVSLETARNVAIIVLLGLVVWLAPGGGEGASFISQLLNAIFIVLIAVGCGILYRRFRGEIFSLGDTWRFALYAAVGVAIVTVAASRRLFDTGAGAVLWFALVGGASYTLYLVWQRYRSYT